MRFQFLIYFILFFELTFAQNLVLNPSFEDHKSCPRDLSLFKTHIKYWTTASNGSSDYFHACSKTKVAVPKNYIGKQDPKDGKAYAGFYTFVERPKYRRQTAYREYVRGELIDTLFAGETYQISFYISLADKSRYAIKDLGILFVDKPFFIRHEKEISFENIQDNQTKYKFNYQEIYSKKFYSDSKNWIKISLDYHAKGDEKYFIIGNFKDDRHTEIENQNRLFTRKCSYYYIDQVNIELSGKRNSTISN